MLGEVFVIFMVYELVEQRVFIPRRTGTNEFSVGCADREKNGIIHFLVVWDEVPFITVNDMECRASDCVRVVGKRLDE